MDVVAQILWYYYWALTLKSMSCQHFFQQNHIPETCIITKYKFAKQALCYASCYIAWNAFLHSLKKRVRAEGVDASPQAQVVLETV